MEKYSGCFLNIGSHGSSLIFLPLLFWTNQPLRFSGFSGGTHMNSPCWAPNWRENLPQYGGFSHGLTEKSFSLFRFRIMYLAELTELRPL